MLTMKDPKVKICAIAKNEGYFLPQWVYHHFYVGFDAIDVYVNRSDDKSLEILQRLERHYPGLHSHKSDWIDSIHSPSKPVGMQYAVYSYDYYHNCHDFDYVLFIDIDEFFVSKKLGFTIKDNIKNLNYPDLIFYEWVKVNGREIYKTPIIISDNHVGFKSTLGKSLVKGGLELTRSACHIPEFKELKSPLLADGSLLRVHPERREHVADDLASIFKDFFIFHDWMRSPIFFLSSIQNGWGFEPRYTVLNSVATGRKEYNPDNLDEGRRFRVVMSSDYKSGYLRLIHDLQLAPLLEDSRKVRIRHALNLIRMMMLQPEHPLSQSVTKSLGNLNELFYAQIKILNVDIGDIPLEKIMKLTAQDVVEFDEKSSEIFRIAMALYTYGQHGGGWPIFLSARVGAYLNAGLFTEAEALMETWNEDKFCDRCFYKLSLARQYEKRGRWPEAVEKWRELQFTRYFKEAQDGLKRLAAHV